MCERFAFNSMTKSATKQQTINNTNIQKSIYSLRMHGYQLFQSNDDDCKLKFGLRRFLWVNGSSEIVFSASQQMKCFDSNSTQLTFLAHMI